MDLGKGFVSGMFALTLVFSATGGASAQPPNAPAQPANAPAQPPNAPHGKPVPLAVDLAAPVVVLERGGGVVVIQQVNGVMIVRPTWNDEQIERWVFGTWGAAFGRRQLECQLTEKLQDLDRGCSFTQAQRKKLELAGRGDIKRFFDRYERLRQESRVMEHIEQNLQKLKLEATELQLRLNTSLFLEHSLLVKSLPNTLTKEQFARYQAKALKDRGVRHDGFLPGEDAARKR